MYTIMNVLPRPSRSPCCFGLGHGSGKQTRPLKIAGIVHPQILSTLLPHALLAQAFRISPQIPIWKRLLKTERFRCKIESGTFTRDCKTTSRGTLVYATFDSSWSCDLESHAFCRVTCLVCTSLVVNKYKARGVDTFTFLWYLCCAFMYSLSHSLVQVFVIVIQTRDSSVTFIACIHNKTFHKLQRDCMNRSPTEMA